MAKKAKKRTAGRRLNNSAKELKKLMQTPSSWQVIEDNNKILAGYTNTKNKITSLSAQLDDVTTKLETKLQEQIARLERILA